MNVTYEGKSVKVVSTNGGWSCIEFEGGEQKKVRNSTLEGFTAPKTPRAAKAAKPAKVKKAKAPRKARAKKEGDDERLVPADLTHYAIGLSKTPTGKATVDIDDQAARMLRGLDLDAVYKTAASKIAHISGEKVGETEADLRKKYKHLNPGMQRMNVGNVLRGALRNA